MADRIGVDIGGSFIKAGLISPDGSVRTQADPVPTVDGPGVAASVVEIIRGLLDGHHEIESIGISSCGIVDTRAGLVLDSVSLPGYAGTRWPESLAEFGLPVHVVNDASAAAWAEFAMRDDRSVMDWVHVPLGTSVGSGIIIDGKLWHGQSYSAGEIGHITVEAGGPVCSCGNVGCLELYVSNESVLEYVRSELDRGRASSLDTSIPLDLFQLGLAEEAGDPLAHEAFQRMGRYLGVGLTTLVNLFNPAVVTIGGGTMQASGTILETARRYVEAHALAPARRRLRIMPGKLGNQSGYVGAALLSNLTQRGT